MNITQNNALQMKSKTTAWKVGIVVLYYFVYVIFATFAIGAVQGILTAAKVTGSAYLGMFWVVFSIDLIVGFYALHEGIKFVSKKTSITKKDVNQTILWFAILEIVFIVIGFFVYLFPADPIILVINCIAIKVFFQKKIQA